jgi:hypothetical protein
MGGYASRLDIDQSGERKTHAKTDKTKTVEHSLYYAGSEGGAAQLTHVAGNGDIASNDWIVVDDHIFVSDYVSLARPSESDERAYIHPRSVHFSQLHRQAFQTRLSRRWCVLT